MQEMGQRQLKNITEEMTVYRILGAVERHV
jgi:hypothetical protein